MSLLRRLYARLRLRINEEKSAIDVAWNRKLLGYDFWLAGQTVKRGVASKALRAMKDRVREITRRSGGRSLERVVAELRSYLVGWKNYFHLADTPRVFRELDEWIRRRLRALQLKQWKQGRTIYRELCARGLPASAARRVAANADSWWKNSAKLVNVAFPIRVTSTLRTARCGPACRVVWQGTRGIASGPYADRCSVTRRLGRMTLVQALQPRETGGRRPARVGGRPR